MVPCWVPSVLTALFHLVFTIRNVKHICGSAHCDKWVSVTSESYGSSMTAWAWHYKLQCAIRVVVISEFRFPCPIYPFKSAQQTYIYVKYAKYNFALVWAHRKRWIQHSSSCEILLLALLLRIRWEDWYRCHVCILNMNVLWTEPG